MSHSLRAPKSVSRFPVKMLVLVSQVTTPHDRLLPAFHFRSYPKDAAIPRKYYFAAHPPMHQRLYRLCSCLYTSLPSPDTTVLYLCVRNTSNTHLTDLKKPGRHCIVVSWTEIRPLHLRYSSRSHRAPAFDDPGPSACCA